MHTRLEEAKSDLLDRAVAKGASKWEHTVGDRSAYIHRYYRHVAPEDLLERDPVDIYGAAASHRQLGALRAQGTAAVRAFTPSVEEHGWALGHTVVEVITDDMPFLVDSVTMELARTGRAVHLIIHPQLVVRRTLTGELEEITDLSVPDLEQLTGMPDALVESWIHVECDRETDPEVLREMEASIHRVLRDVREAVEDWPKMRLRAEAIADELARTELPVPDEDVREAEELLRWLADDHFTFLGYREYLLDVVDGEDVLRAVTGSGLGILRSDQDLSGSFGQLPPQVRAKAREKRLLILTKANSRSTVHRPTYLDYIGIKMFDEAGEVIGERRFLGLFTSAAYTESVTQIPVLRRKVTQVLEASGYSPTSHGGKDLLQTIEIYPRDELFQTPADELLPIVRAVVHLAERRQLRLFIRRDEYGRFLSCLVYLPRDRYNTTVRLRMQDILLKVTGGATVDYTARVTESLLARLHFVIRMPSGQLLPDVDLEDLEAKLVRATRSWADDFADAVTEQFGEELGGRMMRRYAGGFPESYKEDFPARTAVADLRRIEELPDVGLGMNLYQPLGAGTKERRFKLYRTGRPISLTDVLPILVRMGVEVVDERPYDIVRSDGTTAYLYDFGLRYLDGGEVPADRLKNLFQDAFAAVWWGNAESDAFNSLVMRVGLNWREVAVLRAYAKYQRQAGTTYSMDYIAQTLADNPGITERLIDLFNARFDPDRFVADDDARAGAVAEIETAIRSALDHVASLDQDRMLRSYMRLIQATLRTNYFQPASDGSPKPYLSFKLHPPSIPELPQPRPMYEIWVYAPRVEGVHLRFGPVARGGLRWSDRPEDFRTEVLGLVKAQEVKNSVIVPVGAKGGFVAKQLPDPSNREAWLAEGVECYKTFVRGMLDITDNREPDASITPPPRVVRHDSDDPYLVVAADKGTAKFSDIANQVSLEYDFWLGDAFASGGSAGYDHKGMGITARGAWESVKRHFREMNRNCQEEDFTVVGIGDMSGDVCGNGLLLSRHARLVGAFDHRDIFLDPDPDAATSWVERKRLFDLPRSSWADYDPKLISPGGGVYPRTAKSIPVSDQVRQRLGIPPEVTALTPAEMIRAILTAPVDLLFNGGIGTYVKASTESHADVGDRSNDSVRVDGADLRCLAVGEGGNLGFTQLGRIEYALNGGRINTDAIDNSAGVDTSDHEVNIKVLLDRIVRAGDLTTKQRNALLTEMTGEVAQLVLQNNYNQNIALANALSQAASLVPVHRSYIEHLERRGEIDRRLEFLPTERQLQERQHHGQGLSGPEIAVLLSYTKNLLSAELLQTDLPDDPYLRTELHGYFPSALRKRFGPEIDNHPLRREIITTSLVNGLINQAGISFVYRVGMKTAASAEDLARAHTVAKVVFGMPEMWDAIEALDNVVPADVQSRMRLDARTIVERATRWLAMNRRPPMDIAWQIEFFSGPISRLIDSLPGILTGRELASFEERMGELLAAGVPKDLAGRVAVLAPAYAGLGIVENSLAAGTDVLEVARIHFTLGERLNMGHLLQRIIALPRSDRWQTMARAALRDDLHAVHAQLTRQVLEGTDEDFEAEDRVAEWERQDLVAVQRTQDTLAEIAEEEVFDLARLSVALRVVRTLVRSSHS